LMEGKHGLASESGSRSSSQADQGVTSEGWGDLHGNRKTGKEEGDEADHVLQQVRPESRAGRANLEAVYEDGGETDPRMDRVEVGQDGIVQVV
jgi:hypothetical protein